MVDINNVIPVPTPQSFDKQGNSVLPRYFPLIKNPKFLIGLSIILLIIVFLIFILHNVFQNGLTYAYAGKQFSLGGYTYTTTKDELIFIGKFENMYSASDNSVYATITYTKSGKKRIFFIPLKMFALYEPKTFRLDNIDPKTLISNLSGINKLRGRTMAFYIATTQDPQSIPQDQRNKYSSYFDLLGKHFLCNQQFIQELKGTSHSVSCTPFIQTVVAKM